MTADELVAELSARGWTDLAAEVQRRTGGLSETVRRWLPGLTWTGDAFCQGAALGSARLTVFDQSPIARLGISIRFAGIALRATSLRPTDDADFMRATVTERLEHYINGPRSAGVQVRITAARSALEALRIACAPDCTERP